jgi:hypothetical protein
MSLSSIGSEHLERIKRSNEVVRPHDLWITVDNRVLREVGFYSRGRLFAKPELAGITFVDNLTNLPISRSDRNLDEIVHCRSVYEILLDPTLEGVLHNIENITTYVQRIVPVVRGLTVSSPEFLSVIRNAQVSGEIVLQNAPRLIHLTRSVEREIAGQKREARMSWLTAEQVMAALKLFWAQCAQSIGEIDVFLQCLDQLRVNIPPNYPGMMLFSRTYESGLTVRSEWSSFKAALSGLPDPNALLTQKESIVRALLRFRVPQASSSSSS